MPNNQRTIRNSLIVHPGEWPRLPLDFLAAKADTLHTVLGPAADDRVARPAAPPTPAFELAGRELADRVPPMGRHALAPPWSDRYYETSEPHRWLAAASRTNSAHLYLWEATRENQAGMLMWLLFHELGPEDAIEHFRRFGVTHLVVTAPEQTDMVAEVDGFEPVWHHGEVVIFEVTAAAGPPPAALLQPSDPTGEAVIGTWAVVSREQRPEHMTWTVDTSESRSLVAAVAYHPRWRVAVDGDPVEVARSADGLVSFSVPPGTHDVTLRYVRPGSDHLAVLLTLITLGTMAVVAGRERRGRARAEDEPGRRRRSVSWSTVAERGPFVLTVLLVAVFVAWLTGAAVGAAVVAVLAAWIILKIGFALLRGFAAPPAEPPPPGELRKVKITYRCSICGTEVRMTSANDEVPEPPRHCQEDMDLVAPIE
jgi:hypothetical protein